MTMTTDPTTASDIAAPQGAAKDHHAMNIVRVNLRMATALRDMTYAEVSRKADLSRNVLSQFIAGHKSITYSNLLKICDALDVPIGILHYPDTITAARIRLHKILLRTPDHLAAKALAEAQAWAETQGGPDPLRS
jgi:DNA-binding Xre family transcriptional regulator